MLNTQISNYLKTKSFCLLQAGFCKNFRTTDKNFILKTVIDKYVQKRGNKLFACFIDFKKPFHTVWHNGLLFVRLI